MKIIKAVLALTIVAAIGAGLWLYWRHAELYPNTQDAYVSTNIVTLAAQVPGRVAAVNVAENQHVKSGDILFALDDTAYSLQIEAAAAAVSGAQAALSAVSKQLARIQTLVDKRDLPRVNLDDAQTNEAQARAALVGNLDAQRVAHAQLRTAQTNVSYATVTAPADGWIANLSLRAGSTVTAFAPLFSLVESSAWWVDANFKETDLVRIRPGQSARLAVDMLPGEAGGLARRIIVCPDFG